MRKKGATATSEPRNKAAPGPPQDAPGPAPPPGGPNPSRCSPNSDPWRDNPNPAPPQGEPKPGRPCDDRERGSATVLATGIVAALVVSAMAFTAVGQATAARHRAQGAADVAALAGAAKVLLGDGEACAAAQAMAADAAVELDHCEVRNLEVTVYVSAEPSGIPASFGPARAVSRAGPVKVE
ncbi:Rv3654c family TadE-like protein [Glycomyces sp. NRRL B-16210]|uniref:Rv3654c family TadE-like protein n=1 Tax=Glycomyces sp. NRRL B-16210 TaxID=1463821 RepID=UPI00068BE985|nr:Rv3654c family TadE-like protein [Glycomyces sp. NRRL B-16210]